VCVYACVCARCVDDNSVVFVVIGKFLCIGGHKYCRSSRYGDGDQQTAVGIQTYGKILRKGGQPRIGN